jgi:hypothetical protein
MLDEFDFTDDRDGKCERRHVTESNKEDKASDFPDEQPKISYADREKVLEAARRIAERDAELLARLAE